MLSTLILCFIINFSKLTNSRNQNSQIVNIDYIYANLIYLNYQYSQVDVFMETQSQLLQFYMVIL